ncbi:enhanced level of genomic instability 1 isoform X2 [Achroia grisella]|nr:enhanced level of genomic instability 1 isoform X2 [Achroia grisella]
MSNLLIQNDNNKKLKTFPFISSDYSNKKQSRHVLKAKENFLKHKCNKALKKKLKKYKLRHDGKEDPEVLDVSNTLIRVLKIKSPTNSNIHNCLEDITEFQDTKPKNYLFKMGKRKQTVKSVETLTNIDATLINVHERNMICVPISDRKETIQKNAFQLLMDSRNKSIGSNSPGKERTLDEVEELQENFDKKSIKAKRKLMLQKMAESRGSLEKKDLEDYQEHIIKKKLEKRAQRFKNMIINNGRNSSKKCKNNQDFKCTIDNEISPCSSNKIHTDINDISNSENSLTLINIFKDSVSNINANLKYPTKEDDDFMSKLSPSLKKKESMLCYFNKLEKDTPVDIENTMEDADIESVDNVANINIIKVKLNSKSKKKAKKGKLSLKKANIGIENKNESKKSSDCNDIKSNVNKPLIMDNNKEVRKRKRKEIINNNSGIEELDDSIKYSKDQRPKRATKKPVKYTENVEFFSSDEELHIITPKKKKNVDSKEKSKELTKSRLEYKEELCKEVCSVTLKVALNKEKKRLNGNDNQKKEVKRNQTKSETKLAPIFKSKLHNDPAFIEAKNKFLHSGVPDKLKNKMKQQRNLNTENLAFPTVVHVQQITIPFASTSIPFTENSIEYDYSDDLFLNSEDKLFKNLVNIDKDVKSSIMLSISKSDKYTNLQNIKRKFPKFPVYRTYRMLKDKSRGLLKDCEHTELDNSIEVINGIIEISNDNLDKLNWTNKYRATSAKQVVGNSEAVKELKKWIVTWTESQIKSKKILVNSDSSDFYQSDTDSKDSLKASNQLLIITGPVGSGKTTSVYAVAAELAIKVIEVNTSSKRTGKIMLQDLQEATQSHKVNRGKCNLENSQKMQDVLSCEKNNKKKGKKKQILQSTTKDSESDPRTDSLSQSESHVGSQEITRTGSSLILIDDADIVFEQDDGFCSAIMQLIQSSKRPVILIASSTSCPHLQRFFQFAKNINMRPLLPRTLGTWLDILCLADNGICWPGTGANFLDFFKGDIRKALNSLQFYVTSQIQEMKTDKESDSQNSDIIVNIDDENSSMSWAESEVQEEKYINHLYLDNNVWKSFMREQSSLLNFRYPMQSFNMWWSLSSLLKLHPKSESNLNNNTHLKEIPSEYIKNDIANVDIIAKTIDALSIADYCNHFVFNTTANILSQPWYSAEIDNVSEHENFRTFNRNYEFVDEISHELITRFITATQERNGLEVNFNITTPDMTYQRERNKIISQHNMIAGCLNPSAVLDRKALALDYWPACRSVCRIEKAKTDHNLKRNNRFCHYLKSLNILCKSDSYDNLGNSLSTKTSNC